MSSTTDVSLFIVLFVTKLHLFNVFQSGDNNMGGGCNGLELKLFCLFCKNNDVLEKLLYSAAGVYTFSKKS